jgi:hypothetical protein
MNHQKLNQARYGNAEKIEADKKAILRYLNEHGKSKFSDLSSSLGIGEGDLTNRLLTLRKNDQVIYLGRTKDKATSNSWYSLIDQPDEANGKPDMSGYPATYLAWGGWKIASITTNPGATT